MALKDCGGFFWSGKCGAYWIWGLTMLGGGLSEWLWEREWRTGLSKMGFRFAFMSRFVCVCSMTRMPRKHKGDSGIWGAYAWWCHAHTSRARECVVVSCVSWVRMSVCCCHACRELDYVSDGCQCHTRGKRMRRRKKIAVSRYRISLFVRITTLPCGHCFHTPCIVLWWRRRCE